MISLFTVCGSSNILLASVGGVIASPNYPNEYDNDLACSWIVADKGYDVRIHFESFVTQDGVDFLYVSCLFCKEEAGLLPVHT